ncbi:MAG: hypothetical protein C4315_07895 [Chloroflexota bacterium]|mgnify:CR=1 FL=1
MALGCEAARTLVFRCGRPAVGICRYCGGAFCGTHAARTPNGDWVCYSRPCQVRAAVRETVLLVRMRANPQNQSGLCGASGCGVQLPGGKCGLCGQEFCPAHLNARAMVVPAAARDDGARKARLFFCDDCVGLVDRYRLLSLPETV